MSDKVGQLPHDCVRDELPRFHDHSWEYDDGDFVRCSCGKVWLVTDARFCYYREMRGRKLRKLIESGFVVYGEKKEKE